MFHISVALILFLSSCVKADYGSADETDWWDDFTNNFATDLAPLVSLFGDQITKQFLSGSTTILDSYIFAMGPMGIITTVVSCIRVAHGRGSLFLKSVVGRALEPHGQAEVELCSSTSENVCELWSNGGICRVFGQPKIIEFVYREPTCLDDYYPTHSPYLDIIPTTCGIMSTREFFTSLQSEPSTQLEPLQNTTSVAQGVSTTEPVGSSPKQQWTAISSGDILLSPFPKLFSRRLRQRKDAASKPGAGGKDDQVEKNSDDFAPFPNLALNLGAQKSSNTILASWIILIFGILLQASYFGYATWVSWYKKDFYKDGEIPRNPVFFILTILGAMLLSLGMGLCLHIVDRTSEERRFVSSDNKGVRMFWLQPGGQHIGDQEFGGFAHDETITEYITSWKTDEGKSSPWWVVWSAIGMALVGWMAQFIGQRGLQGTITLYQLVVTIIMTILRALLRSYRNEPHNTLPDRKDIEGHELDWQAVRLVTEGDNPFEYVKDLRVSWLIPHPPACELRKIEDSDWELMISNSWDPTGFHVAPNLNTFFIRGANHVQTARNVCKWIETRPNGYWPLEPDTMRQVLVNLDHVIAQEDENDVLQPGPRLMRIRSRLAYLTDEPPFRAWGGAIREMAVQLKLTLQKAGELLGRYKVLPRTGEGTDHLDVSLVWSMACKVSENRLDTSSGRVCFHMARSAGFWTIDAYQLEAVLGLWLWSFRQRYAWATSRGARNRKRLAMGPKARESVKDVLWAGWGFAAEARSVRDARAEAKPITYLSVPTLIDFESPEDDTISTETTGSVLGLMAQDIFASFLERVCLLATSTSNLDAMLRSVWREEQPVPLFDSESMTSRKSLKEDLVPFVDGLKDILVQQRLATKEEALLTIIPTLYHIREVRGGFNFQEAERRAMSRAVERITGIHREGLGILGSA